MCSLAHEPTLRPRAQVVPSSALGARDSRLLSTQFYLYCSLCDTVRCEPAPKGRRPGRSVTARALRARGHRPRGPPTLPPSAPLAPQAVVREQLWPFKRSRVPPIRSATGPWLRSRGQSEGGGLESIRKGQIQACCVVRDDDTKNVRPSRAGDCARARVVSEPRVQSSGGVNPSAMSAGADAASASPPRPFLSGPPRTHAFAFSTQRHTLRRTSHTRTTSQQAPAPPAATRAQSSGQSRAPRRCTHVPSFRRLPDLVVSSPFSLVLPRPPLLKVLPAATTLHYSRPSTVRLSTPPLAPTSPPSPPGPRTREAPPPPRDAGSRGLATASPSPLSRTFADWSLSTTHQT